MSFQPGDRFHLEGHPGITGTYVNSVSADACYVVWDTDTTKHMLYFDRLLVKTDEPDSNVPEEW